MEVKATFILCKDWINYTNEMTITDKGLLLDAIMKYQNGLEIGELPYAVKIVFSHMRNFFETQNKKVEEFIEKQKENGKKGGRPKSITTQKPKKLKPFGKNPTKPKKAYTVTVTDTVTDTVTNNNLIIKEKLKRKELDELYLDYRKIDVDNVIADMEFYCTENNKQYKNYNLAIRKWLRNNGTEKRKRKVPQKEKEIGSKPFYLDFARDG